MQSVHSWCVADAPYRDPRLPVAARVADLHVWEIGPGYRAAIVSVAASGPCQLSEVERLIPADLGIAHVSIEVRPASATSDDASS